MNETYFEKTGNLTRTKAHCSHHDRATHTASAPHSATDKRGCILSLSFSVDQLLDHRILLLLMAQFSENKNFDKGFEKPTDLKKYIPYSLA